MEDKPRPYLTAALLCEKVLVEKDGSLSVVRIADSVRLQTVMGEPPPDFVPTFNLSCLIAVKSGPVTGDHNVRLVLTTPSGREQGKPIESTVKLLGKDQGQNLIFNLLVTATEEGLHWIHVWFDDIEMTQIPLIVSREKQTTEHN